MNNSHMQETSQIGEFIYQTISENSVYETCDWAVERINRVMNRLNSVGRHKKDFKVVIPYLGEQSAFTAPGEYIFISRQMFQMCRDDDMAAFIIAHEMAHHSLGHIKVFPNWFKNISSINIRLLFLAVFRMIEKRIYGVEMECEADRLAIKQCIKAGYEVDKCLVVFKVLEDDALNKGNINSVFGSEEFGNNNDQNIFFKIKKWFYYSKRGYLPIRERKNMVSKYAKSIQQP